MNPLTWNQSPLSNSLLQQFEDDGFVLIQQFLTESDLEELESHLARFMKEIVPSLPADQVFYEDKSNPQSLKQIQHMDHHDSWFEQLMVGPMRSVAQQVLCGPVTPKNLQFFNKPPSLGRATPPHQDGFYFMISPCIATTLWLALDATDEENGCVTYVRHSHKLGMRDHSRTETVGFSQGITDFPTKTDVDNRVPIHAAPGDLLAHQAMTIHFANANRSRSRSRRALGFIYYRSDVAEDSIRHQAYQQQLANELKSRGKI